MQKRDNLPHGSSDGALHRCQAKSKRSGKRCKRWAIKGKTVCSMHGGKSTGARTIEGQMRSQRGNWKHGLYSVYGKQELQEAREYMKQCRDELKRDAGI